MCKAAELETYSCILHAQCLTSCQSSKVVVCRDQAEMTNSVTKYFHSDGYLNEAILSEDVQELLKQPKLSNKGKSL